MSKIFLYGKAYGLYKLYRKQAAGKQEGLTSTRGQGAAKYGVWENRRTFSEADEHQVHEAPSCKLRKQVTMLFPISEACLVQQQQCRALIHSTVCKALVSHPVQVNNGFKGKLTDGHGGKLQGGFSPISSVIIGYLRFLKPPAYFPRHLGSHLEQIICLYSGVCSTGLAFL